MLKHLLIKILLIIPFISISQELLINTSNRNITSLNGTWSYIVDPYETGYYNYRYEPYDQLSENNNSAFYNNYHTTDKLELVEYDFDKSLTLTVPGDWNSQYEKLFYYEGTVWYKRSFDYSFLNENNRLFVYFGAINYKAEVYLNGKKLGTHEGGFTPFNFEVSGIVKPTNNYLVVKVDNKRFKEAVPTINTDWWNYGGITRDVKLIEEPKTYIQNYKVQLKKGASKIISGYVKLNDGSTKEEVTISIPELKINKSFISDDKGVVQFEIKTKNISFWSPESPKLYDVFIKTTQQTLKDEIGFRTIETVGPDILLNGKSIFLRGICIHEENAMRGARAYNEADALVALNWAKELGCNYVRLAHYPHNEHIVKLADKMGMMVWEEIPVYWTVDFTNETTLNNAKNQLTEAITRDKNRASIIIWSMANETPPSNDRNTFLKNLINHSKSLDDTRLVSAALEKHFKDGVNVVDDEIGNYLDIVAFNQYTGWYGGSLEDAPNAKWDIKFNKPVVISEFGGGALQGLHGTIQERWTEEYQEYLYVQNLKMIEKIPNIRGVSPWILNDFRSPKRVLPNIQDGWNRKGLISNHGIKKKAFFTVQEFYKNIKLQYQ
ncbi:glycoside hydrolase family 2 protein [uncultured Lutibacter sp.]|uniref:glycoside hydrolase family 2 protein n=1 Tax=uncultured Lutibacter sp. TaxID=437739 RepID=UPI0026166D70|nr:glycoside hydrolase family 2 TIM barrel-domain containing protein [uncultured Lutibacter sp.]